ncbi:hypothetical protein D3C80_962110 [compost metagenome]
MLAERAGLLVEAPGDGGVALRAATLGAQPVVQDAVPVTLDQRRAAARTEGRAALGIVHIARVDIVQPLRQGDLPGAPERCRRGARGFEHLEVGVEGGEVQRHIRPQFPEYPGAQGLDLPVRIVVIRNQQGGDLRPDVGLVTQIDQGIQHRLQMRAGELEIEVVGEGLEVDIRRVHHREEFAARFGVYVAGGHRHRANAAFAAGDGRIDGVFGEDHRIVVGEGHAGTARILRRQGNLLRAGLIHQAVHVPRFADIPVLAKLAGEIAAGRTEGQHRRSGEEVVERLLLDGVDAEAGRAAVGGQHHLLAFAHAHEAGATLPVAQLAVTRAEVALDSAIGQAVPPAPRVVCGQVIHRKPPTACQTLRVSRAEPLRSWRCRSCSSASSRRMHAWPPHDRDRPARP